MIGGGLAGVCAAIAAARLGRTVALVNNRPVLGGNSSSEVRVWVVGATAHGNNHNAREGGIMGELFVENQFRNPDGNPYYWDTVVLARPPAGDPALRRGVDAGEQPQQGRLPGAVGALDPDQGVRGQVEVDPAQHPGSAEAVPPAHASQPQLAVAFSGLASLGRMITKPSPSSRSWTASPDPPRIMEPKLCERCSEVVRLALQPTTASVSTRTG